MFVMGSSKDVELCSIFNTEMVFGSLLLQIMVHFKLHVYIFMHFSSGCVVLLVWCWEESHTWSLHICI